MRIYAYPVSTMKMCRGPNLDPNLCLVDENALSQALAVSPTRSRLRQAEHSYSTTPSLLPIHPRLPLLLLLLLLLVVLIEHVNLKCRRLALPKKNSEIVFKT